MDGLSPFPSSGGVAPPASVPGSLLNMQIAKNEVVMTLEQARTTKVQKGYSLEPVRAVHDEALPEKRSRQSAIHFGYDQPASAPSTASRPKSKPKIKSKLPAASAVAPVYSYQEPLAPAARDSSCKSVTALTTATSGPLTEKKGVLRERLRRIIAQIARIEAFERQAFAAAMPVPVTPSGPAPSTGKRKEREPGSSASGQEKRSRVSTGGAVGGGDGPLVPRGKTRPLYEHCRRTMQILMGNVAAQAYFNAPVDWLAENIPDYLKIIERPMDLGTVTATLEAEGYASFGAWVDDVRQVWRNAMDFNPPDNDVYQSAVGLSSQLELALKKAPKISAGSATPKAVARDLSGAHSASGAGSPALAQASGTSASESRKMLDMQRNFEQMQRQLDDMKNKSGGGGATKKKAQSGAGASKRSALTFDEKQNLSLDIGKLDHGLHPQIMKIIKTHAPSQADQEEIDIDSLDTTTLRKLQAFVANASKKQAAASAKRPGAIGGGVGQRAGQGNGRGRGSGTSSSASDSESESESESDSDSDRAPAKSRPRPPAPAIPSALPRPAGGVSAGGGKGAGGKAASTAARPSSGLGKGLLGVPGGGEKGVTGGGGNSADAKADETAAKELEVAEPSVKPVILPTDTEKKSVEVTDTSAWASLAGDEEEDEPKSSPQTESAAAGTSQLWSRFQNKNQLNQQRELERKEEEERERARAIAESKRREEEAREQARLRKEAEEAAQRAAAAAAEEEKKQLAAKREEEKKRREQVQQTVNMDTSRMVAKDLAGGAAYMGLQNVGGLNIADLRGGESDSDSEDSD